MKRRTNFIYIPRISGWGYMFVSPLIILLAFLASCISTEGRVTNFTYKCTYIRSLLSVTASPIPLIVFNNTPIYSSMHNICTPTKIPTESCCAVIHTPAMENHDYLELEQLRVKWLQPIFSDLVNDTLFFQNFFVDSLNLTMATLDSNFMSSYGYNYQKNRDFFVRFFANLESYMLGKRQNLSELVDDFFHELLIRIVRLLLFAKSESDLNAADCISAELEKKNPFDRIPGSIKKMTLRAFPPARIIANALLIGSESIFTLIQKVKFRKSCHIDWIKLRYCGLCAGYVDAVACPNVCRLTMARCFADYAPLVEPWTQFIDNLIALTGRLRDSDSFPQVNRPLQIHITDAIMNFQRFFSQTEQSLLKNCNYRGAQPLAYLHRRQRRQLRYPFVPPNSPSVPDPVDYFQSLPSLGNQAKLIREKYRPIRSLFETPETVFCSHDLLHTSNHTTVGCWDGERVLPSDLNLTISPPQPSVSNPIITRLVNRLRHVTEMLRDILRTDSDPDFLSPEASFLFDKSHSLPELQSKVSLLSSHGTSAPNISEAPDSYDGTLLQPFRSSASQTTVPSRYSPSDRLDTSHMILPSEGSGFITFDETSSMAPVLQPISTVFQPISDRTSAESSKPSGVPWDDEDWPGKPPTRFRQPATVNPQPQLVDTPHPGQSFVDPPYDLWQTRGQDENTGNFLPSAIPRRTINTPHEITPDTSSAHLSLGPRSRVHAPTTFVKPPNQLWIPQRNYMHHENDDQLLPDSHSGSTSRCAGRILSVLSYSMLFFCSSNCVTM